MTPSPHLRTDTVVIGGGQAGLALSRHLTEAGHDHVLLERGRIGERWYTERWPTLRLLTPDWLNVLPGAPAPADPDGFTRARDFADGLRAYAESFGAPVREHEAVRSVAPAAGGGYVVHARQSRWHARNVVIATGECDRPHVPGLAAGLPAGLRSVHAAGYGGADTLPAGAVLVVGAGASGQQLAAELVAAGRRVVLAVGRHGRLVRRYRDRDIYSWMRDLGMLTQRIEDHGDSNAARRGRSAALVGGAGDLDLGVLREAGVELAGRLTRLDADGARFAGDLAVSTAEADARLWRLLDRIDQHAAGEPGLPAATRPRPVIAGAGPRRVSLGEFGTVLWATGYRRAYPWLHVPVLDARGELVHDRGSTPAAGLHVLGLRFQRRRWSHMIGGVGDDARILAERLCDEQPSVIVPRRGRAGRP